MRAILSIMMLPILVAGCKQTAPSTTQAEPAAKATQEAAASPAEDAWQDVAVVSIEELERMRGAGDCTVIDANGDETRTEFGMIPGAVTLSNYQEYLPASELPADKGAKLVFYCSSTSCTAAPKAAVKAMQAGYSNVSHLKVGIKGWVEAGKKVQKFEPKKKG